MKTITIHQCEHLPYLGLIHKIRQSDVFVVADDFQFKKNYFENRNKIRTKDGWDWITVPVEKHNHKPMNEVYIQGGDWKDSYLGKVKEAYKTAINFKDVYETLEKIINNCDNKLYDLNFELLDWFLYEIQNEVEIVLSSSIDVGNLSSTERLVTICKALNADTYISGIGGKEYLELSLFEKENIQVKFNDFTPFEYKQQFEPFIPNMSCLDYLMNREGIWLK